MPDFREVLDALEKGRASHVLFAAPPHVAWSLPLYELALLTTTWLVDHDIVGARLTLATPDPEPLSAFGATASQTVRDLLSDRGIELVAGVSVPVDVRDGIELGRLGRLHPDRIVTLPRLVGHPPAGLPGDADGFIPVDDLGGSSRPTASTRSATSPTMRSSRAGSPPSRRTSRRPRSPPIWACRSSRVPSRRSCAASCSPA